MTTLLIIYWVGVLVASVAIGVYGTARDWPLWHTILASQAFVGFWFSVHFAAGTFG